MTIDLHHADLIIPNGYESQARDFYCKVLGLTEVSKPEVLQKNGGIWLQLGNAQLHLSYENREGVDPKKTKAHIAFRVADLSQLKHKLISLGFTVKDQESLPGMIRMESEDPFGHRLEFLQIIGGSPLNL